MPPSDPINPRGRNHAKRAADLVLLEQALIDGVLISQAVAVYAKTIGISTRQGWADYQMIKAAWAREALSIRNDPDRGLGQAILRRDQMYRACMKNQDLEQALKVEQDRSKLLDLYEFDKQERTKDKEVGSSGRAATMAKYKDDPVGYATDILKITLTPDQQEIARGLLTPPYRIKARAGHSVGKTFIGAMLVNWWYDTRDPGIVITTAPTLRDVCDLMWAEVRLQRNAAGLSDDFTGDSAPHMSSGQDHWAKGYTARKGESFQGRHRPRMLFIFDEDEGIEPSYYRTTDTMFDPAGHHAWLSIGNPTTTTSQSYREEQLSSADGNPKWNLFTLSCLNHPNIAAGLAGLTVPVPGAVTVAQVDQWVQDWCDPIDARDKTESDFEWRPNSGKWYRPGPIFQSRVLGQRPTQSTNAIWSESAFNHAVANPLVWRPDDFPELGVDVARFGDDWTCIHGRQGPCSTYYATGNGWATTATRDRVIEACNELARRYNSLKDWNCPALDPKEIAVKIDDDGVGGGVTDMLRELGYNVVPINAGTRSDDPENYPRRRDELWFEVAKRAKEGSLDLSRLDKDTIGKLRTQAMAPKYSLDFSGRRVVEPKVITKKILGRSPDDMDALNLSFSECYNTGLPEVITRDGRAARD